MVATQPMPPAPAAASKPVAPKRAPFPDYAWLQGLGMIGEGFDGITIDKTETTATAMFRDTPIAYLQREGPDAVIISLLVQDEDRKGLAPRGFIDEGEGWFRIRLGNDPDAWTRADITGLLMNTFYTMRQAAEAGRWRSILSQGGPYVVLPKSCVERWGEDGEGTDIERAMKCPDTASLIDVAAGRALILGTPDRLYFQPRTDGGVFVRVISLDVDDDDVLAQHVAGVPEALWTRLDGELTVTEQLWAFDASQDGVAIGTGNSLQCDVPHGGYGLDTATFTPDDGTELLLVRLRQTS